MHILFKAVKNFFHLFHVRYYYQFEVVISVTLEKLVDLLNNDFSKYLFN